MWYVHIEHNISVRASRRTALAPAVFPDRRLNIVYFSIIGTPDVLKPGQTSSRWLNHGDSPRQISAHTVPVTLSTTKEVHELTLALYSLKILLTGFVSITSPWHSQALWSKQTRKKFPEIQEIAWRWTGWDFSNRQIISLLHFIVSDRWSLLSLPNFTVCTWPLRMNSTD